jgi:hypothetical protein
MKTEKTNNLLKAFWFINDNCDLIMIEKKGKLSPKHVKQQKAAMQKQPKHTGN